MNDVLDIAMRATLLLGVAFMGWVLLKSGSAQARSTWLRAAILGLVALPLWVVAGPEFHFDVPWVDKPAPMVVASLDEVPALASNSISWGWMWALVAILLVLRMSLGGVALARMWSRARPADDDLNDELYQALARLDVARPVDFRLAQVGSPMTFGIRRACVVVPEDFSCWPVAHREAALMHEAAHIRRFDCGWQWLAASIRALLWCHPLVWWLAHAIRDEAELAADERVIAAGIEATDYATALVEIARTRQPSGTPVAGTAFMREGQLSRRVSSALHSRRGGFTPVGSLGIMAVAMGVVVAVGGLRPQLPQADVIVVRGQSTPIVINGPQTLEFEPAEIDDMIVTTDAVLAPLPPLKARPAIPPTKVVVTSPKRTTVPATVAPEAKVETTLVMKPAALRTAETGDILIVVGEPVAVAPSASDTRRVVVVTVSNEEVAPKDTLRRVRAETYAFHSFEGKEFRVDIPSVPPIPMTTWSEAERAEFKRSMELLERELKKLDVDEKFAEKARKSVEEARRLGELAERSRMMPPIPPVDDSGQ